jgi:2-C-methyl-D-erythritol 4-phosphate cytidylyltransferase
MADKKGNAVPVVPVVESVRETDGVLSKPVDRSKLRIVQTPQVFRASLIKNAYMQNYREDFTDDTMVLESAGYQIHLTEGNAENIKITDTIDLAITEKLLRDRSFKM